MEYGLANNRFAPEAAARPPNGGTVAGSALIERSLDRTLRYVAANVASACVANIDRTLCFGR